MIIIVIHYSGKPTRRPDLVITTWCEPGLVTNNGIIVTFVASDDDGALAIDWLTIDMMIFVTCQPP